jgi:hypothetical protein
VVEVSALKDADAREVVEWVVGEARPLALERQ